MKQNRFSKYAWGVLIYNILVILWGAYVRATGSGAGCGSHWPLCNGEILPRADAIETLIEFTHRLSSGGALLLVIVLYLWSRRVYPKASIVRTGARYALIFIVTESLLGAGLVLFKLTAKDESLARAISIVLHLINTFILIAWLSLTAWWSSGGKPVALRSRNPLSWMFMVAMLGTVVVGASGALTALGDTLFPVNSLAEGIIQDFSQTAHFLIRLRLLHPTLSVIVGLFLLFLAGITRLQKGIQTTQRLARLLTLSVLIQLAAGAINVLLLAPVWMQIVHLLLADMVWITLVLTSASALQIEEGANQMQAIPDPTPILGPGGI